MRKDKPYVVTEIGPQFVERYRRPWDLEWMKHHPKFIGFMQGPVDSGLEAGSFKVMPPYRENILKYIDAADVVGFAPYVAWMINAIHEDGPGRDVVIRLAIKKR